ncbi:carboxymuconolactone decarboxylase family protein [Mesorhizobium sp. M1227]|uniref:carboxymuconolactone decarboxylase family protein n=1 Tax=Mesorhizobium sp. M1227 TaxID=2957071 RepID=UPI003335C059
MNALWALEHAICNCCLEPSLIALVRMRASQINGCAYCIHMHTRTLARSARRKSGLYLLDGWRRADSLYSERERRPRLDSGPLVTKSSPS